MQNLVFSQIDTETLIDSISKKVLDGVLLAINTHQPPTEAPDRWFDLPELCDYHPDKPTKSTVYGWVHDNLIPVNKGAKKLRFLKSEIDNWIKLGRKITTTEAANEAANYLNKKGF